MYTYCGFHKMYLSKSLIKEHKCLDSKKHKTGRCPHLGVKKEMDPRVQSDIEFKQFLHAKVTSIVHRSGGGIKFTDLLLELIQEKPFVEVDIDYLLIFVKSMTGVKWLQYNSKGVERKMKLFVYVE